MDTLEKIAISIPEAVQISGLSRSYLYEKLSSGEVESRRAGKRRLVLLSSLKNFINNLPSRPAANKGTDHEN